MSSSDFPENILPQMTSSQPFFITSYMIYTPFFQTFLYVETRKTGKGSLPVSMFCNVSCVVRSLLNSRLHIIIRFNIPVARDISKIPTSEKHTFRFVAYAVATKRYISHSTLHIIFFLESVNASADFVSFLFTCVERVCI